MKTKYLYIAAAVVAVWYLYKRGQAQKAAPRDVATGLGGQGISTLQQFGYMPNDPGAFADPLMVVSLKR